MMDNVKCWANNNVDWEIAPYRNTQDMQKHLNGQDVAEFWDGQVNGRGLDDIARDYTSSFVW